MLDLAWSTLRSRIAGFVGAFVALTGAAAVVTTCGVLLDTGLRGDLQPQRYAGTPIVVAADQNVYQTFEKKDGKVKVKGKPVVERAWLDRDLVGAIAGVPGVASAVAEVSFAAHLVVDGELVAGPDGSPSWGHGWGSAAITPMALRAGSAPRAADEVVVDAELAARSAIAPGDVVTIASLETPAEYRVAGIAAPPGRDGLDGQSALYFTDAEADRLAGRPGQAVAIGVATTAGADVGQVATEIDAMLAAAVGDREVVVRTGSERGRVELLEAEQTRVRLISLGGAVGGTSLLVAVLVVVGTFTLQLQQRRREIALLRAVAATPRQVRRMVGAEAAVVGGLAGVLGAAVGVGSAGRLRLLLVDVGVLPEGLDLVISPLPAMVAVLVTVAAAWVAARVSVRRSARIAPTEALAEATVDARLHPLRIAAGLAAGGGYVVVLAALSRLDSEAAATPVTFLSVVLAAIAVALLGPLLTWSAAAVAAVPLRLSGRPSADLAADSLRSRWGRSAPAVTPLCLMVAMTGTVLFVPATLARAADEQLDDGSLASHVVVSNGLGVPPDAIDDLAAVDGVTAVTARLTSTVRAGLTQYPIQGLSADAHHLTVDLDVRSGTMRGLDHDTVAVSERYARDQGTAVGDTIDITLGDRTPASLRVVAVYRRGLGFGDLTVTAERLAAHVDDPRPRTVLVASSGPDDDLGDRLEDAVAVHPGVSVLDRERSERAQQRDADDARTNLAVMAPIVAFALVAAVNTFATTTSQRAGELALLRRIGATRRQLRRAIRWEVAAIAALGAALGTGIALATLTAFARGMADGAGASLPSSTLGVVTGSAIGVALVTASSAARTILRAHPSDTSSHEVL